MRVITTDEQETRRLGEALGRLLRPGDVVGLSGEMGAGKTVLAQGIGVGLGVDEPVSSPTFALVHLYRGRVRVWHLDTYRVNSLDELIDLSWDDLMSGDGVILVEWPERIAPALPPDHLAITLSSPAEEEREIELLAHGERMRGLVRELEARWFSSNPSPAGEGSDEIRGFGGIADTGAGR